MLQMWNSLRKNIYVYSVYCVLCAYLVTICFVVEAAGTLTKCDWLPFCDEDIYRLVDQWGDKSI